MPALDITNPEFLSCFGVALLCGLAVGLERQLRGRPAGLRTCALICVGSMLFARMGVGLAGEAGDPARMAGQIVVGVGFLGAGVIFNRRRIVHGMTTAAVVWVLAAIGTIAGLGAPTTALVLTGVIIGVLVLVASLERRFKVLRKGEHGKHSRGPAPEGDGRRG